jgi:hypothetical protein
MKTQLHTSEPSFAHLRFPHLRRKERDSDMGHQFIDEVREKKRAAWEENPRGPL